MRSMSAWRPSSLRVATSDRVDSRSTTRSLASLGPNGTRASLPDRSFVGEHIAADLVRRSLRLDGEELPCSIDALEFVVAAILELEASTGDEHGHGGRH